MDQKINSILFALVRCAIRGEALSEEEKQAIQQEITTRETFAELFKRAHKHDVAHLLGFAFDINGWHIKGNSICEMFSKEMVKAVYRYEMINFELGRLCEAFEAAHIPFLPLKGSVIRKYYLHPWQRTSCDVDVLVHEEDLDRATALLTEQYGYRFDHKGTHDVSLFSDRGQHLELHYTLIADGVAKSSCAVLRNVWNACTVADGCAYRYEMSDEMFYFYHIAHMAKHLEEGGCGVRPLIDLWILDGLEGFDPARRDALLEQGQLLKFAEQASRLSRCWLDGEAYDEVLQQLENYILRGGVYGNRENRVAVQQQKKGGRFQYALSRIFIPYEVIKFHYPILQKHRWLTPIMEVRRWGKLLFCGHAKRTIRELQMNNQISSEEAEQTGQFLKNIGL